MTNFPSHIDDGFGALIELLRARGVRDLALDSRRVQPGDAFIAVPGRASDGRQFIDAAIARGAVAVLVEADGWSTRALPVPVLPVNALSRDLGRFAAAWYGEPSRALLSIGVTGTNGKTSCSQWIAQALTHAGRRCGVIGTVGSGFPGALDAADLTTPDPVSLQRAVRSLHDAGAQALAMEVSSIGLDQGRVDGMRYDIAVFTNLTRDHLDYHGTMAAYGAAKARLFDWPTLRHAVINLDDAFGRQLAHALLSRARRPQVIGTTLGDGSSVGLLAQTLTARDVRATADGLAFVIDSRAEQAAVEVPLVGQFNVANLLAVTGTLLAAGLPLAQAAALLPQLAPPPGRMQRVGGGAQAPLAVVDYAHTPDALAQAIAALRPVTQARGGALWVVFGAGGDRDPGKRAPMGAAAAAADRIVVTSDNPRSEDPASIVAMVAAGVPADRRCERIVDRAQAIAAALAAADARDVVLIAGKGHEDYQDVQGTKRHFSDVQEAERALRARKVAA
ncbi:MAG: UDP-N-acetylmuramoyl-L-alanyl-D-glutamate--2,6-diaminopimelate ligase [Burkholderiaceae bacterium]|nr:UDP-N-acetylmuramoyl-L-alanyl-D-glutamate--2,6-diaminopimelate ligase [Burkholderiaceae bacterium]